MATLIEKLLLQVDLDVSKTEKNLVIVTQRIIDLTSKNRELKAELEQLNQAQGDHSIQIENVTKALLVNKAELDANVKIQRQYQNQLTQNSKGQQEQTGSLNQLRAQLSELTNRWSALSQSERENSAQGKAIQDAAKGISDKLKEQELLIGDARRNVGNYAGSLVDAASKTGIFGNTISNIKNEFVAMRESLVAMKTSLQAATAGTEGVSGAMKVLRIALISTGIGALVVALGALIAFLTQTERGADALSKGMAFMKGVLIPLKDLVVGVGEFLFKAFTNPKQALIDLVEFIKGQLINRLTAVSVILDGIVHFDFKKIGNGFLQAATGVENLIDKTQEFGNKLIDVAKKNEEIQARRIALEKKQIDESARLAELQRQIEEKRLAASEALDKNSKKKLLEQAKDLVKEKGKIQEQDAREEAAIAQDQINLNKQQNQAITIEDRKDLQDKLNKEQEVIANNAQEQRQINRQLTALERGDLADAAKQRADDEKAFAEARINAITNEQEKQIAKIREGLAEDLKAAKNNEELKSQLREAARIKENEVNEKFAQERRDREIEIEVAKQNAIIAIEQAKAFSPEEKFTAQIDAANIAATQELTDLQNAHDKEEAEAIRNGESTLGIDEKYNLLIQAAFEKHHRALADATIQFNDEQLSREIDHQKTLEDIAGNPFDKIQAQLDADALLQQQELLNTELTQQQRDDIEAKHKKIREDLKKQEVETGLSLAQGGLETLKKLGSENAAAQKAFSVGQAFINTYQGVTAALASAPPPFSFILAGLNLAAGLKAVQQIINTPTPKAEHGDIFKIGGKRHTQGGTKFVGSDGTKFEAEKDELLVILNRRASGALSALSSFNAMHGGKKFMDGGLARPYYADGGIAAAFATNPLTSDPTTLRLLNAIENMPNPVVTVEDFNAVASAKQRTEIRANH